MKQFKNSLGDKHFSWQTNFFHKDRREVSQWGWCMYNAEIQKGYVLFEVFSGKQM